MGKTDNAKIIWEFLKGKGLNDFAVAGIMGNLQAESSLNPKNLQGSYEKKLGFTDDEYTSAVDSGEYDNFVKDKAGYGLAQWTYWSRKEKLLNFAKENNASVGDLSMQLEFLWKELQGYKSVMSKLQKATSILEASNAVLTGYEKPSNQGESAQTKRASFGQAYYDTYAKPQKTEPAHVEKVEAVCVTHIVRSGDTLWEISKKYLGSGVKWKQIAELNGIHGSLIRTGQVLKIPQK